MKELPKNTFKDAINSGQVQVGIWSNIRDSLVVEMLGDSGFDIVTIDCEHAANDLAEVVTALQVLRGTDSQVAVRVPGLDPVALKRVLDAGAQTVIVPYIQTVEEAASGGGGSLSSRWVQRCRRWRSCDGVWRGVWLL